VWLSLGFCYFPNKQQATFRAIFRIRFHADSCQKQIIPREVIALKLDGVADVNVVQWVIIL
jgi:hypothetical protein